MKISRWLACAALTLPLTVGTQYANSAPGVVDPEKLEKVSCSDLHWSKDFLDKNPKAPAACLEARVYKGKRYAKFSGKVYISGADKMTIQVFNVAGDMLSAVTFHPSPTASLIVNGQREKLSEMKVGDPVTIWLSEDRFSVYTAPGKGASQGLAPAN